MKINGKDYELKYNLRAMFIYEEITDKPFKVEKLFDEYVLMYSCIMAVKENPALEFNEFIDYCTDHPELFEEFNAYLASEVNRRDEMGKKKE